MKLNNNHIKILRELGALKEDFAQIEEVISKTKFYKVVGDKETRITLKQTIKELGEETFLSGINRSAFHYTAMREDIYFNSSKYFKDIVEEEKRFNDKLIYEENKKQNKIKISDFKENLNFIKGFIDNVNNTLKLKEIQDYSRFILEDKLKELKKEYEKLNKELEQLRLNYK